MSLARSHLPLQRLVGSVVGRRRTVASFHQLWRSSAATPTATSEPQCHSQQQQQYHFFSTESENVSVSGSAPLSPKLQPLYGDITKLTEEEVNILGAVVLQVLGRTIFPGQFGKGVDEAALLAAAAAAPADGDEEDAAAAKTAFAVKLVGFDAKAKIKVIKEVRAIAGLGLKEAKELVESAPKAIQKDVTQEKADELKAQLEAVGAQIEIE